MQFDIPRPDSRFSDRDGNVLRPWFMFLDNIFNRTGGAPGILDATSGGTGHGAYVIGDLLQANATTTLARLPAVATGNALISGGVGAVSSWGKIGLTTHVSGILPLANGGTNAALTASNGGLVYSTAAELAVLAGTATAGQIPRSGASGAPSWSTFTVPATFNAGDLLHASASNTVTALADVATGNALISGGVGIAPAYGKIGLTTHISGTLPIANGGTNVTTWTANQIVHATATDVLGGSADLTFDGATHKVVGGSVVQQGSISILLGADNVATTLTNATLKAGRTGVPHYTNAEEPVALFLATSNSTDNVVNVGGGSGLLNAATRIGFWTAANNTTLTGTLRWSIDSSGNLNNNSGAAGSAYLHIKAGTATAGTAQVKLAAGTLNTTAEAMAIEATTDNLHFTITTGAARKGIMLDDGTRLTSGRVPFATTNGRLTDDADLTFATDTLTATKMVGSTSVKVGAAAGFISSDGSTGATGTFVTADPLTVTVKDGIVVSIV